MRDGLLYGSECISQIGLLKGTYTPIQKMKRHDFRVLTILVPD